MVWFICFLWNLLLQTTLLMLLFNIKFALVVSYSTCWVFKGYFFLLLNDKFSPFDLWLVTYITHDMCSRFLPKFMMSKSPMLCTQTKNFFYVEISTTLSILFVLLVEIDAILSIFVFFIFSFVVETSTYDDLCLYELIFYLYLVLNVDTFILFLWLKSVFLSHLQFYFVSCVSCFKL